MAMRDDDEFFSVVGSFYEASLDPAGWDPVVARLQRHFGGVTAGLMMRRKGSDTPDMVSMNGFSEDATRLYAEYYHGVDPWAAFGLRRPTLRAVLGEEVIGPEAFQRTELWNDFMRPHVGAFHIVGATFEAGDGRLALFGLQRPCDAEAFSEEERLRLERMLPHLQRALQLWRGLERGRQEAALGRAALDEMRNGVVVTGADGVALLANRAAEALSREGGALSLGRRGHPLSAARPEETRRLLALLRDAAEGGPGGSLLLPRPDGGAPVAAMVSRVPTDFVPGFAGRNAALLVLRDLGGGARGLGTTLGSLFGLTPAEAELACALAAGKRPDQVAQERGVMITTIRSQLSALLHKTGARRQGDLLGLLERIGSALPGTD